ncbi:MAG: PilZ domain-containing protein [Novosphingobium sp.]|nr:PilZ domain-containing protein [Novosphingobium sp.]MCP5388368.1 PilZ domain-containing protein [Novosphingobium sp.]
MFPKIAQISSPVPSAERRGAERRIITFGFDTEDTQNRNRILILNLSRTGLLLQTSAELQVGEEIQIAIPEAGAVNAKVVRQDGDQFGAMFELPITKAAVSAVLLVSPAIPATLDEAEIDAARRSSPTYDPVPEWLLWTVLLTTTAFVLAFVYALAFLPTTS